MKMRSYCKYLILIVASCLQQSCVGQSTTVRPYKFGFTIDEQQHRREMRDERGIVMGEFGFITADGIYHVTVYATDEQGRFRILAMKSYPYESPPKTVEVMVQPKAPPTTTTAKPLTRHNFNTEACSGCFLRNGNDKPKTSNGIEKPPGKVDGINSPKDLQQSGVSSKEAPKMSSNIPPADSLAFEDFETLKSFVIDRHLKTQTISKNSQLHTALHDQHQNEQQLDTNFKETSSIANQTQFNINKAPETKLLEAPLKNSFEQNLNTNSIPKQFTKFPTHSDETNVFLSSSNATILKHTQTDTNLHSVSKSNAAKALADQAQENSLKSLPERKLNKNAPLERKTNSLEGSIKTGTVPSLFNAEILNKLSAVQGTPTGTSDIDANNTEANFLVDQPQPFRNIIKGNKLSEVPLRSQAEQNLNTQLPLQLNSYSQVGLVKTNESYSLSNADVSSQLSVAQGSQNNLPDTNNRKSIDQTQSTEYINAKNTLLQAPVHTPAEQNLKFNSSQEQNKYSPKQLVGTQAIFPLPNAATINKLPASKSMQAGSLGIDSSQKQNSNSPIQSVGTNVVGPLHNPANAATLSKLPAPQSMEIGSSGFVPSSTYIKDANSLLDQTQTVRNNERAKLLEAPLRTSVRQNVNTNSFGQQNSSFETKKFPLSNVASPTKLSLEQSTQATPSTNIFLDKINNRADFLLDQNVTNENKFLEVPPKTSVGQNLNASSSQEQKNDSSKQSFGTNVFPSKSNDSRDAADGIQTRSDRNLLADTNNKIKNSLLEQTQIVRNDIQGNKLMKVSSQSMPEQNLYKNSLRQQNSKPLEQSFVANKFPSSNQGSPNKLSAVQITQTGPSTSIVAYTINKDGQALVDRTPNVRNRTQENKLLQANLNISSEQNLNTNFSPLLNAEFEAKAVNSLPNAESLDKLSVANIHLDENNRESNSVVDQTQPAANINGENKLPKSPSETLAEPKFNIKALQEQNNNSPKQSDGTNVNVSLSNAATMSKLSAPQSTQTESFSNSISGENSKERNTLIDRSQTVRSNEQENKLSKVPFETSVERNLYTNSLQQQTSNPLRQSIEKNAIPSSNIETPFKLLAEQSTATEPPANILSDTIKKEADFLEDRNVSKGNDLIEVPPKASGERNTNIKLSQEQNNDSPKQSIGTIIQLSNDSDSGIQIELPAVKSTLAGSSRYTPTSTNNKETNSLVDQTQRARNTARDFPERPLKSSGEQNLSSNPTLQRNANLLNDTIKASTVPSFPNAASLNKFSAAQSTQTGPSTNLFSDKIKKEGGPLENRNFNKGNSLLEVPPNTSMERNTNIKSLQEQKNDSSNNSLATTKYDLATEIKLPVVQSTPTGSLRYTPNNKDTNSLVDKTQTLNDDAQEKDSLVRFEKILYTNPALQQNSNLLKETAKTGTVPSLLNAALPNKLSATQSTQTVSSTSNEKAQENKLYKTPLKMSSLDEPNIKTNKSLQRTTTSSKQLSKTSTVKALNVSHAATLYKTNQAQNKSVGHAFTATIHKETNSLLEQPHPVVNKSKENKFLQSNSSNFSPKQRNPNSLQPPIQSSLSNATNLNKLPAQQNTQTGPFTKIYSHTTSELINDLVSRTHPVMHNTQENNLLEQHLKNSIERHLNTNSPQQQNVNSLPKLVQNNIVSSSFNTTTFNKLSPTQSTHTESNTNTLNTQFTTNPTFSTNAKPTTSKPTKQGTPPTSSTSTRPTGNLPPIMDMIMREVIPTIMGKSAKTASPKPVPSPAYNKNSKADPSGQKPSVDQKPSFNQKSSSGQSSSTGNAGTNPTGKFGGNAGSPATSGDGDLYRFKYILDYHGHTETGKRNGNKEGSYFVIGNDNVERTIEYVANELGYQPRIRWRKLDDTEIKAKENTLKEYEFIWFQE